MDNKEYSRLRSIARKRIERASAAGLMEYVYIPSVKEIMSSANPEQYMSQVKRLVSYDATVRNIRKGKVTAPAVSFIPTPLTGKKVSDAEKKARKREQNRRSKAKRAIERTSATEAEARKKVGYLRAMETVAQKWRDAGVDVGNWLGVMSPGMSKKFVEYMEYRFSQGDYKNRYTIDTFIRDFGTLVQKGYDFKDIQGDFSCFLVQQERLKRNMRQAKKYGITEDEFDTAWRKFVNR